MVVGGQVVVWVLLLVVQVVVVVLGKVVLHVGGGTAALVHVHEVRLAILGVVVLVVVQDGRQMGDGRWMWVGVGVGVWRKGAGRGHGQRDARLPLRRCHRAPVGLVLDGALWRVSIAAGSAPSSHSSAAVPLVLPTLTVPSASPCSPRPPAPLPSGPASPAIPWRLLLVDQASDGATL